VAFGIEIADLSHHIGETGRGKHPDFTGCRREGEKKQKG
jgi:hypothetical protein